MPADAAPWRYQTFLLRIWAERSTQPPGVIFRPSLADARTRERRSFENPEGLLTFLHGRLDAMRKWRKRASGGRTAAEQRRGDPSEGGG